MTERSKTERRAQAILALAEEGLDLTVEALAERLGASRETVRRDLRRLDRAGQLRRVHGGAVAVLANPSPTEDPFHARMRQAVRAKRAMAAHVAASLRPGDSLFIDTGSTTIYLAEALSKVKELTVITNSARIAMLAAAGPRAKVVLLGGEYRTAGQEALGAITLAQIGSIWAGQAVLTVASVTPFGCFDIDPAEAEIARAMASRADRVTVLADASKFRQPGVFEVCPLSRLSRLVTDHCPPDLASAVRAAGGRIDEV
ncbi:MAG: DeoR/GlpR family DNA-binding transcription regulator [Paracoccaceae bacterium]